MVHDLTLFREIRADREAILESVRTSGCGKVKVAVADWELRRYFDVI